MAGDGMPKLGQMLPYVLRLPASDRRWRLWGYPGHTGGPERLASIKPISDVAPALLAFYPFSCVVVATGAWFTGDKFKQ